MSVSTLPFPRQFRWGTATSAYQVEGNLTNNDWWAAEQAGGYVYQDHTAAQACDWWNRAEEDFDRMAETHQNAHRLSVEWSRIEPQPGVWDNAALERYRAMLVGLRQRGIEPMVTLHHFTNPLWLVEQGGWENPAVVGWFERYVRKVVSALGDLTSLWCTINEPTVLVGQAYMLGRWPPAKRDMNTAIRVLLNLVRAHAAAYHAVHEIVPAAQVGIAQHLMVWQPWRPWWPVDQAGTRFMEHMFNQLPLLMMTRGLMRVPGRRAVPVPEAANTLDWIGANYYQRYRIQIRLLASRDGGDFLQPRYKPGTLKGPGSWGEIHPRGLFTTLKRLWRRYRLPIFVTENGIPDESDEHRPDFIVTHLYQVWQAINRQIPVLGYYFWSLVDNFEWTEGYDPRFRFGLFAVDHQTQERAIRNSGRLYAAICRSGGLPVEEISQYAPAVASQLFRA